MLVEARIITRNLSQTKIGELMIYFSYATPIVFVDRRGDQIARHRDNWSQTTKRHIRRCGGRPGENTVNDETFERLLDHAIKTEVLAQIREEYQTEQRAKNRSRRASYNAEAFFGRAE